ncbi:MAG: phage integrase N-terminal SAM-like domain-containing protein, partial [Candidatus Binatia bacterium]
MEMVKQAMLKDFKKRGSHTLQQKLERSPLAGGHNMKIANVYRMNRDRILASQPALMASATPSSAKPKLLDQVRQAIRTRHYSPRTEETYIHWIKRFIFFHNKRHPGEMAEAEIA